MKITLTACITMLIANLAFAHQLSDNDSFRCRNNYQAIDATLPLSEQLKLDLTSGFWIDNNEKDFINEVIYFEANGKGEWIQQTPHKHFEKNEFEWSIVERNAFLELVIEKSNGDITAFEIAPNCEGISLDTDKQSKFFEFSTPLKSNLFTDKKDALIGEWENILPKVELEALGNPEIPNISLEGVRVKIAFRKNGAFEKAIVSKEGISLKEQGKWDLSKDGQYIYLHCTSPEGQPITQAVKIKHLELDEMVLEQPLALIGKSYSTNKKYFFFNKI